MKFKNVNLEEDGLLRIIEAANCCESIVQLHVGIVSDVGLITMGERLVDNKTLCKLEF